jgi:GcvH upstream region-like protein
MFTFFRRYQRVIYFVITAVIIFSFSFFGTYSAFTSGKGEDPVVFRTIEGKRVTRSEFNDYVHFLSTDGCFLGEGGGAPANFLNDGVIPDDIIATGIGEVLIQRFSDTLQGDFVAKLGRERAFQPYHHPQAAFVSAMQVWSYFAPDIKNTFDQFRTVASQDSVDIYRKKAPLFLAERRFPPAFLRQVLAYQQQQFSWLEPDVALESRPLSLFGYTQVTDWFGPQFVDKVCEFIIQTACKARAAGFTVSTAEALTSMYQNAQRASQRLSSKDTVSPEDLFRRSLRELNMDQSRAVAIWSDVILFRKALIELPMNIVVNTQPFEGYLRTESESCDLDCYQLQPSLRCTSIRDLQRIEMWLQAVSKGRFPGAPLLPPADFLSPEEVVVSWPEFVERKFIVNIGTVTFDELAKNIRLRDIWNWQVADGNWELLVAKIPSLGVKEASDRTSRLRALDSLSAQLRVQADTMAKEQLVKNHPEWLQKALSEVKLQPQILNVRVQGGSSVLAGIEDRQALIAELAKAPIGEPSTALNGYTQDEKHFYRIQVVDRSPKESLVSLPDLIADGTLDKVVDRVLEASYGTIRSSRPADFRKDNGEWKPFQEVKEKVGEIYFSPIFKELDRAIAEWKNKLPSYCQWDDVKSARVAVRFLSHLVKLSEHIKNEADPESYVTSAFLPTKKDALHQNIDDRSLKDLWLLVSSKQRFLRREAEEKPQFSGTLALDIGTWMPPKYSQELGPFVAVVVQKEEAPYDEDLRSAVYDCQKSLGREAIMARSLQLVVDFFGKA